MSTFEHLLNPRGIAVVGACTELDDATKLPGKEGAFPLLSRRTKSFAERRWHDEEIEDDGLRLTRIPRGPKDTPTALNRLTRIGGAGQDECCGQRRNIDTFIEASNSDKAIECARADRTQKGIPRINALMRRERAHLKTRLTQSLDYVGQLLPLVGVSIGCGRTITTIE